MAYVSWSRQKGGGLVFPQLRGLKHQVKLIKLHVVFFSTLIGSVFCGQWNVHNAVCFFFVTGALDLKSQLADKLHVIPQTFSG